MKAQLTQAQIRPWLQSDAESLAQHANSRAIWLNLRDGFPHPYGVDDARAFLAKAPPSFFCIAVDDLAVGGIGVSVRDDVERFSAELGYWLGEAFWGRGIVTEAIAAVTDFAFAALGMRRVFALPYAHNRASQRVLEKVGYACEGRLQQASFKDGKFVDQFMYAKLSEQHATPAAHVLTILAVPDLSKAVSFYDQALGWPHAVNTAVYVEMRHPSGQRLGLYEQNGFAKNTGLLPVQTPDGAISSTELYFHTNDYAGTLRNLEAAGAGVLSASAKRPWGDEAAYFRDPFGNVLVVAH